METSSEGVNGNGNVREQASYRRSLAILQAASSNFARHGYIKTKVADIARDSGVTRGLVLHFFGSKEDLAKSLLEDSLKQWSILS